MKRSIYFISVAIISTLFIFTACGGDKKKKHGSGSGDESALFAYPIPTTFEVTDLLNKAGASYILSVTNDVNNIDKYVTVRSKALNLGVYSADLCYSSTYNMHQDVMTFLNATKLLLDQLEINTPFNQTLAEKLGGTEQDKDSAIVIVTETIKDTYNYLKSNGKEDISLLVMAGSFVEGLYITTQMATTSPENEALLKAVAAQKTIFVELNKLLEPMKDEENIKEIYNDFIDVDTFFDKIVVSVKEDQLQDITRIAENIRNKIIY
jgi:hypothetical protein